MRSVTAPPPPAPSAAAQYGRNCVLCYHRGPLLRDDEARERERDRDGVAATRVRLDDDEVVGGAVLLIVVVDVCVGVTDTDAEADTLVVALEDDVCESVLEGVTVRDLDADLVALESWSAYESAKGLVGEIVTGYACGNARRVSACKSARRVSACESAWHVSACESAKPESAIEWMWTKVTVWKYVSASLLIVKEGVIAIAWLCSRKQPSNSVRPSGRGPSGCPCS